MITQVGLMASLSMLETSKSTTRGIDRKFPSRSELLITSEADQDLGTQTSTRGETSGEDRCPIASKASHMGRVQKEVLGNFYYSEIAQAGSSRYESPLIPPALHILLCIRSSVVPEFEFIPLLYQGRFNC